MDKYFSALASSNVCDVDGVKVLMEHELFSFNTPNRLRSVVSGPITTCHTSCVQHAIQQLPPVTLRVQHVIQIVG
jgi:hypothetical protein